MLVRKGPLEAAALFILQHSLMTEDHARMFAEESGREMARITAALSQQDQANADRLSIVLREMEMSGRKHVDGRAQPDAG